MTVARNTRSARKRRIQEDEEHPGQQVQQEQQGQEESELKTTPTKLKKVVQTSSKKKTTKANAESETEAMDVDVDVDVEVPKEEGTSLSLASSPTATTTTSPLAPRNLSTITPESNINIDPVATPPSTPPLQQQPPPTSSSSSSKKKKKKKSKKRKSNLSSPDPESQSQLSSSSPLALTSPSPCSSSKKAKKPKKSKSSISISPKSNPTPIANPQIAVQVHRFRNANYIPRAILKLCATPLLLPPAPVPASNSNSTSTPNINVNVIVAPHLAISREGGSVELVSVDEKWKCVAVVEGMKNRNVDAMAWVCDGDPFSNAADAIDAADTVSLVSVPANSEGGHTISGNNSDRNSNSNSTYIDGYHEQVEKTQSQRRLFGASRDGTIFEIDFKSKRHVGVIGSGGGAVFCLTSLYGRGSSVSSSSGSPITNTGISADFCNLIAAGCEDGSVRIFQTLCKDKSNNLNAPSLELVSTLPSVGNAITSIAWLPPPPSGRSRSKTGASSLEGSVLFAGVADGTIRKFVVSSVLQSSRTTGSVPHAMSTGMILTASIVDSEAITATATTMAENGAKSSSSSSSPSSSSSSSLSSSLHSYSLSSFSNGSGDNDNENRNNNNDDKDNAGYSFPDIHLSIQFILNCGGEVAGSCKGGSSTGAFQFIKDIGYIPFETCQPYMACSSDSDEDLCNYVDTTCNPMNICKTCTRDISTGLGSCHEISQFPNAKIDEYGVYKLKEANSIEEQVFLIKSEIAVRGPVAAAIAGHHLKNYTGGIIYDDESLRDLKTTHEVSIVGWDVGTDDASGVEVEYWIIRNSWGEYWGEMSFFRLQLGTNMLGVESYISWATIESYSVENVPCFEDGQNCNLSAVTFKSAQHSKGL
mmetsp:Transcript_5793/g.8700  ORF Transcript_5793/g.8700 Transcript_5793/m.8700 type:complete len:871 (-) Transcript_5793:1295-3907(-)